MTLIELRKEARRQVETLALRNGFGNVDIWVRIWESRKTLLTPQYIIDFVCGYYRTPIDVVFTKTRKVEICLVRQIIQYLMHKHCSFGSAEIGKKTGGRDHATVLNSIKRIKDYLDSNRVFAEEMELLESELITNVNKSHKIVNNLH